MKQIFFVLFPLVLAASIFFGVTWYLNKTSGKGALQVTASPKSNVYLNGKLLGQTPLRRSEGTDVLDEGEYSLRVVPLESGFTPFEQKITITSSVLTVVDWTFGKGASSEGSIISLAPIDEQDKSQMLLLSFPAESDVLLDSSPRGKTPLLLKDIPDSDHEVTVTKAGYKDKALRVSTKLGYKLLATVFLGLTDSVIQQTPPEGTPSASLAPSPTTLTPSPGKITTTPTAKGKQEVVILDTPNGFLRVRAEPTTSSDEVARVKPGEAYALVSEQSGWYEIQLTTGDTGWISGQFAQKQ